MTTKALNGLWEYLQTLSLTKKNKDWLASKLIEPQVSKPDETDYVLSSQAMQEILEKGEEDIRTGNVKAVKLSELWN